MDVARDVCVCVCERGGGEGGEEGKREEGREERGERRGALGQGNWWRGRKGEKEKSERFMLRIPLPLF